MAKFDSTHLIIAGIIKINSLNSHHKGTRRAMKNNRERKTQKELDVFLHKWGAFYHR